LKERLKTISMNQHITYISVSVVYTRIADMRISVGTVWYIGKTVKARTDKERLHDTHTQRQKLNGL